VPLVTRRAAHKYVPSPVHSFSHKCTQAACKIIGYISTLPFAFACTTDLTLSIALRQLDNVSQLRIHRTVTLLDVLSTAVKNRVDKGERGKLKIIPDEIKDVLAKEKAKVRKVMQEERVAAKKLEGRKRKKASGPNPLSQKKGAKVAKKSKPKGK